MGAMLLVCSTSVRSIEEARLGGLLWILLPIEGRQGADLTRRRQYEVAQEQSPGFRMTRLTRPSASQAHRSWQAFAAK